ncbi:NUDIX hydrolase [Psychrobacter sanguinis]|uniref:NUDIX hydrolase n=1 Tax=Psychrobacter sanguinis TaxID=861445 RepID=UPI001D110619|nr:CoA pyrophosphatase [Psychrobacter sanguinis]
MKSSIETLLVPQNLYQNEHSLRFEELAVVLPEQVIHPKLRQLVERVQQHTLHATFKQDIADTKVHTQAQLAAHFQGNSQDNARATEQGKSAHNPSHSTATDAAVDGIQSVLKKEVATVKGGVHTKNTELSSGDITRAQRILDKLVTTDNADAAVLVVITNEAHPKMLLTRRAAHLSSHAGEVSFAGGKHDTGDGNNVVTALREACEETALPPSKAQIVGQLPIQVSKKGLVVRPIVALVEPPITYVPELGEIARIFWADFETLIEQPTTDHILPYTINGQTLNIKTPSWRVDGEVVWGLTGRVLAGLLQIGFDREVTWYYEPVDGSD